MRRKRACCYQGELPPTNDEKIGFDKIRVFTSVPETILSLWRLKIFVAKKFFFFIYVRNLSDTR